GGCFRLAFYIPVDDIDRHPESRSSSKPAVLRCRLPFSGHDGVTGRYIVLGPHPKPKGSPKGYHPVMAHQLRMLQQRKLQIDAGLAVIIRIAQLDRPPSIIGLSRRRVIGDAIAGSVLLTMSVLTIQLFRVKKSPGIGPSRRSRSAIGRFMRDLCQKSGQLAAANLTIAFSGK